MEKEQGLNGNGKVEVPREAIDLIAGLKPMSELAPAGVEYSLTRIEWLSRMMDDAVSSVDSSFDENIVPETAVWIQEIIEDIRKTLSTQDHDIWSLQRLVEMPNETAITNKDNSAQPEA